jgi:hypothetical protein
VFGADSHLYQLNPPLTERDVQAFEAQHHIVLPRDYRGFLIHVGDGGAGPYYGVFKLGEMDHGRNYGPWKEGDGFAGILSEPFPHTALWNDLSGKPDDNAGEKDEEEWERRFNEFDQRYWEPSNVNGAIPICHLGCALRQWLVVTGPEVGHVWCDDRPDYKGLHPLQFGGQDRVTFIEWYRLWLDDALTTFG